MDLKNATLYMYFVPGGRQSVNTSSDLRCTSINSYLQVPIMGIARALSASMHDMIGFQVRRNFKPKYSLRRGVK